MNTLRRLLVAVALTSWLCPAAQAEHPIRSPSRQGERHAAAATPAADPQSEPAPEDPGLNGVAPEGSEAGQASAPGTTDPAPEIGINPLSRMALGDLQAFKDRPLFAPSRRAPNVPAAAAMANEAPPVAETPPPDLRLIGIVAGVDKAVAVLGGTSGPPISVRVGDAVESWQVHIIAPDRVVLRQGDREQAYRLFASAGAAMRAPSSVRKGEAAAAPEP